MRLSAVEALDKGLQRTKVDTGWILLQLFDAQIPLESRP